jgi:hypothetical protein
MYYKPYTDFIATIYTNCRSPQDCSFSSGLRFSQLTRNSSGGGGDHQSWVSVARLVVGRKEGEELRLCLDQRVRLAWQPALHAMLLAAGEDAASLMAALLPPRTAAAASGGGGHTVITHINVSEKVSLLISTGQ